MTKVISRFVIAIAAVVIASLIAFTLNIILPKKSLLEEEEERKEMDKHTQFDEAI